MTTPLAAPPDGSKPPARPDGAALHELGPGALLFWYDQARADTARAGAQEADHTRLLELHAEILGRLALLEKVRALLAEPQK